MQKNITIPFEIKEVDDTGTFRGMASPFGGKPDTGFYRDIIEKGAFTKTIANGGRNGTGIPMLWQHRSEDPIGGFPMLAEMPKGLIVEGKLTLGVRRADEAHLLMKDKVIRGLSIGWDFFRDKEDRPVKGSFEIKDRIRTLKIIDLWEISPVTFPMQTRARITSVKSEDIDVRLFQRYLMNKGISKKESDTFISLFKKYMEQDDGLGDPTSAPGDPSNELKGILESLQNLNTQIKG